MIAPRCKELFLYEKCDHEKLTGHFDQSPSVIPPSSGVDSDGVRIELTIIDHGRIQNG